MGLDYCQIVTTVPTFHEKTKVIMKHSHFGCLVLSEHAVVSLGTKLNNRDSPRDKTLHVKGGYLLPLTEG